MVTVVNILKERADIPVCRPTMYGNPYLVTSLKDSVAYDEAVLMFAMFFYSERGRELRHKALAEISSDAKIGCYCAPMRCHADIIAGYLNWKRDLSFAWTDTTT